LRISQDDAHSLVDLVGLVKGVESKLFESEAFDSSWINCFHDFEGDHKAGWAECCTLVLDDLEGVVIRV